MPAEHSPVYTLSMIPDEAQTSYEYTFGPADCVELEGEKYPPPNLMQYGEPVENHRQSGRRDAETVTALMAQHGYRSGHILDYGCSNGRMTRWFSRFFTPENDVWGVDIHCRRVAWASYFLSDKASFLPVNTGYSLPFEDRYFAAQIFYSVFTHMNETWMTWLQEIRRVSRIGGLAFVTLHDESALSNLVRQGRPSLLLPQMKQLGIQFDEQEAGSMLFYRGEDRNVLQSFFSREFFLRHVSRYFEVPAIVENTMAGFQTLYVLRRKW